jgi:NADH-quinone oxidoreductase subunit M
VVATLGIVLAAVYILWLYQRTMTGPVRDDVAGTRDLSLRESVVVAPLLALILVIGVFPKPIIDVIDDGVAPAVAEVDVDPLPPLAEVAGTGEEE